MIEFKSFYKTVLGNEGQKCRYPSRLDTYGCGCAHNCSYCYARSLLEFRNLWNIEEPKVALLNKIEKKIASLPTNSVVRLGGMTDCFQPCEEQYHTTYETIKLLNSNYIHYLIVTKSDLVASDSYLKILSPTLAHIQISITSTDDEQAMKYEHASLSSKRFAAIEKLEKCGFDVQLRLSPFLPDNIDFKKLNNVNCKKVIVEFLRVNSFIKKWLNADLSLYTHKENGYQHLPLNDKISLVNKIQNFRDISVCEDCTEHYVYWRDNFNPNALDCCNLRF